EVFGGSDNIRDAWSPFGNGDMLERAMMIGYRANFRHDRDLQLAFEMVTNAAARVLRVKGYGMAVAGGLADFVAVEAGAAAAGGLADKEEDRRNPRQPIEIIAINLLKRQLFLLA